MSAPVPSVGRIVHYVSHGSPVREDGTQKYISMNRAAVITVVHAAGDGMTVGLAVLNPTGLFFDQFVGFSEEPKGGTWHWPERV